MGRVITKEEAGRLLGVDRRTVLRFVKKGLLSPAKLGTTSGVLEDEVIRLKRTSEMPDGVAFTVENFRKLWEEVQTLRADVSTLKHLQDIRYDRWQLNDLEIKNLYEQARVYAQDGWSPHVEKEWADRFLSMHLDDFRQLFTATGDEHPWRPFYLLCTLMWHTPHAPEMKDQFLVGRNRLQGLIYTWGQLRGESPRLLDTMMAKDATPFRRLINKLHRHQHAGDSNPPKF